jgi:hypothetical protein
MLSRVCMSGLFPFQDVSAGLRICLANRARGISREVVRGLTFCSSDEGKELWPEYASELYRPSYRRLSAKLVPTFADRGCHVVIVIDLCGHIGFL